MWHLEGPVSSLATECHLQNELRSSTFNYMPPTTPHSLEIS